MAFKRPRTEDRFRDYGGPRGRDGGGPGFMQGRGPADDSRTGHLEALEGPFPAVKLRGLPFSATPDEIRQFLELEPIDLILLQRQGRFSGEAIALVAPTDVEAALAKDKGYIGRRYVEIFSAKRLEYYRAVMGQMASLDLLPSSGPSGPGSQMGGMGPMGPGMGMPMMNGGMRPGMGNPMAENMGNMGMGGPVGLNMGMGGSGAGGMGPGDMGGPMGAMGGQMGPPMGGPPMGVMGSGGGFAPLQRGQGTFEGPANLNGPAAYGRGSRPQGPPEHMVGTSRIVKMRGLPFSVAVSDILQWFNLGGLNIQPLGPNNVRLSLTADGRPNGTAFVEFASPMEAEAALTKDRQMLGSRYVELFPSTPEEVSRMTSGQ